MKLACVVLAAALTASAQMTNLDLGDQLPDDASSTGISILVSPAQTWPEHHWSDRGVEYSVAADDERRVQFLSTSAPNVVTPDGIHVGQSLAALLAELPDSKVIEWPGWGFVIDLPSGWKAALFLDGEFLDREPQESDSVDLLFKGTAAGYGQ